MGINVWFWGPPAWRILFATARYAHILTSAFTVNEESSKLEAVVQWAAALIRSCLAVAPCPFCRPSSAQFVRELEAESGGRSLEDHLRDSNGLLFLYNLRNKVNMKLHAQHLKEHKVAGVQFTGKTCTVPPRTISFSAWSQRLFLRRRVFDEEDVVTLLNALWLDHTPEFARHYLTLWRALARLCRIEARVNGSKFPTPMRQLADTMQPLVKLVDADVLASPLGFSRTLLYLMCAQRGLALPTQAAELAAAIRVMFAPYAVMRVGVKCANETCRD